MIKHPYSTTHWYCGCHLVEDVLGRLDYEVSHFCAHLYSHRVDKCQYRAISYKHLKEWRKKGGLNALQNC